MFPVMEVREKLQLKKKKLESLEDVLTLIPSSTGPVYIKVHNLFHAKTHISCVVINIWGP